MRHADHAGKLRQKGHHEGGTGYTVARGAVVVGSDVVGGRGVSGRGVGERSVSGRRRRRLAGLHLLRGKTECVAPVEAVVEEFLVQVQGAAHEACEEHELVIVDQAGAVKGDVALSYPGGDAVGAALADIAVDQAMKADRHAPSVGGAELLHQRINAVILRIRDTPALGVDECRAGADGIDARLLKHRQGAFDLILMPDIVLIAEEDIIPRREADGLIEILDVAEAGGILDEADGRVLPAQSFQKLHGAIRRSIIADDDLVRKDALGQQRAKLLLDIGTAVVGCHGN